MCNDREVPLHSHKTVYTINYNMNEKALVCIEYVKLEKVILLLSYQYTALTVSSRAKLALKIIILS